MHFRSAFSRLVDRKKPEEAATSKEYTGGTPQTTARFQISLKPYSVAGHPNTFYEVSLTKNGNKLPISSVKVRRGEREFLTTDLVEVREGEPAYVLEVTDVRGNAYRTEPIPVQ